MAENFTEGKIPLKVDPLRRLTVKLLNAVNTGGGGSGGGVTSGNGPPSGAPTGTSGLYYDNLTGIIYQWNGSAWV